MSMCIRSSEELDDKSEEMIFVGYSEESKAYRFLNTKSDRIQISRDATFLDKEKSTKNNIVYVEFSRSNQLHAQEEIEHLTDISDAKHKSLDSGSSKDLQSEPPAISECPQPAPTPGEQYRCSQRSNRGVLTNRYVASTNYASDEAEEVEPLSVKEALARPHRKEWKRAMNDEIESHIKNGTREIVPKPKDKRLISCKWVFKLKRNAEGLISHYKGRLVARGFSQKYGVDYDEVFAPS